MFELYQPITDRKPRLRPGFAWPVGLEQLSARFVVVPQAAVLRVWFADVQSVEGSVLRVESIAARRLAYPVFTARYFGRDRRNDWFLMVYPVEATHRSMVRSLLENSAFPAVEAWLRAKREAVWLAEDHRCDCIYHPDESTMTVK